MTYFKDAKYDDNGSKAALILDGFDTIIKVENPAPELLLNKSNATLYCHISNLLGADKLLEHLIGPLDKAA